MISNSRQRFYRIERPAYDRDAATADLAIFDTLPKQLREGVVQLTVCFRADLVASDLADVRRVAEAQGATEDAVIGAVWEWQLQREATDIEKEARNHRLVYSEDLPHVAAGATVMRSSGPPRRLRRRARYR